MIANYLKVTLRSLAKNKGYSLLNVLGLAIGLACFALIWTFVQNEKSYDSFNPNGDRVYRVIGILNEAGLGEYHNAVTQGLLGPTMLQEIPQVAAMTRLMGPGPVYTANGATAFYEDGVVFADPAVFDVLAVRLLYGDRSTALNQPNSVVIDREAAQKYFGSEDVVGKHLTFTTQQGAVPYAITGVMENYPKNAHVGFSMLVSFATVEPVIGYLKRWDTNCLATYVMLRPGVKKQEVDPLVTALVLRHVQPDPSEKRAYYLQSLSDIHLNSGHILYQQNQNQGNASMLRLFMAIGIFVLLIASINYMNLATARSTQRAKEVGVRKVLGSDRRDLVARFLGESMVTSLLGFLVSLVLVEMLFPLFAKILGSHLVRDVHHESQFFLILAAVALLTGVCSGIYPAFILSAYQPAETLRGRITKGRTGAALRKGLVFAQFGIAIVLLACTGIVQDQMEYIRAKDIGFNKSQLLYVPLRSNEARKQYLTMKDELLGNSSVLSVSAGGGIAGAGGSDGTMTVTGTNKQLNVMMRYSPIDYDFFRTMGISFVQGRDFSREIPSDSATGIIINEAAMRELGWKDAIGKQFDQESQPPLNVIGVVKDYYYSSLYTKLEPQVLFINRDGLRFMLVKIAPGQIETAVAEVEKTWNRHLPAEPFVHGFVDDAFDRMYRSDQNTHRLFIGFSIVAILVGCLGLFGLSAYMAEQRTKEIGIRKTLGASTSSLVLRLSTEFVKLVALSSLVAFPLAYWAMQGWLENFAYRTAISPLSFVAAGAIVVAIAFITVSFQAIKVALANPVESLRYE